MHGADLTKRNTSTEHLEATVREVLTRILESDTLRAMFLSKERDELLNQAVLVGF